MCQDLLHSPYFLSFFTPLYSSSHICHFNQLFYPRSPTPLVPALGENTLSSFRLTELLHVLPCFITLHFPSTPLTSLSHSPQNTFPLSTPLVGIFPGSNSALLISDNFLNTMFNFHGFNHQLHRSTS